VRYYGDRARNEVPRDEVGRLTAEPLSSELAATFRDIGFHEVEIDPRGFRSGSLNATIASSRD
jgi:PP-loop superfamily ATP-utilizing enzyme